MKILSCWSCHKENEVVPEALCSRCQQPLVPTPEQAAELNGHIQFLLREVAHWDTTPPRWRQEIESRYRSSITMIELWPRFVLGP